MSILVSATKAELIRTLDYGDKRQPIAEWRGHQVGTGDVSAGYMDLPVTLAVDPDRGRLYSLEGWSCMIGGDVSGNDFLVRVTGDGPVIGGASIIWIWDVALSYHTTFGYSVARSQTGLIPLRSPLFALQRAGVTLAVTGTCNNPGTAVTAEFTCWGWVWSVADASKGVLKPY